MRLIESFRTPRRPSVYDLEIDRGGGVSTPRTYIVNGDHRRAISIFRTIGCLGDQSLHFMTSNTFVY